MSDPHREPMSQTTANDELFHVEDDRPRPFTDDDADHRRSRLGLDDPQTAGQKAWLTVASLVVTLIATPVLVMVLMLLTERGCPQPWLFLCHFIAEVVVAFLMLVVIYIWWKPAWFKSLYLTVEAKMLYFVPAAIGCCFVLLVVAAILRG